MNEHSAIPMDPDRSNWFPILLAGVLIGVMLMVGISIHFRAQPADVRDISVSYADMAAIQLTAVSVCVSVLAVFIGALAFWGYSQFGKATQNASQRHLEKMLVGGPFSQRVDNLIVSHVTKQLETGELRKIIVERIDSVILSDASVRDYNYSSGAGESEFKD